MTTPIQTLTQTPSVQLTPAAAQIVRNLRQEQNLNDEYGLRVYISAQTCSGFQYGMALDKNPLPTDTVYDSEGLKLIIDETSLQYLAGATIDYIDDPRGKGFLVENPNSTSACSCEGGTCCTGEN